MVNAVEEAHEPPSQTWFVSELLLQILTFAVSPESPSFQSVANVTG